jgi:hypothetical protein
VAKEATPHPLADAPGLWLRDPDGTAIQIIAADKVSPATRDASVAGVAAVTGEGCRAESLEGRQGPAAAPVARAAVQPRRSAVRPLLFGCAGIAAVRQLG